MKDSMGSFAGDRQIKDLAGWIRTSPEEQIGKNDPARQQATGIIDRAGLPRSFGQRGATAASVSTPFTAPKPTLPPVRTISFPSIVLRTGNGSDNLNITIPQNKSNDTKVTSISGRQSNATNASGHPLRTIDSLNIMERRFVADDPDPSAGAMQIPLSLEFAQLPKPDLILAPVQARVVVCIKNVKSTREPGRIDVYLRNQRVGILYLFGMGNTGMEYTMDRYMDITEPHHDILDDCDVDKIEQAIDLHQFNEVTGAESMKPTNPILFLPMLF
jgi:hypothetical protein